MHKQRNEVLNEMEVGGTAYDILLNVLVVMKLHQANINLLWDVHVGDKAPAGALKALQESNTRVAEAMEQLSDVLMEGKLSIL